MQFLGDYSETCCRIEERTETKVIYELYEGASGSERSYVHDLLADHQRTGWQIQQQRDFNRGLIIFNGTRKVRVPVQEPLKYPQQAAPAAAPTNAVLLLI